MSEDIAAAAERWKSQDYENEDYDEHWMPIRKFKDMEVLADAHVADLAASESEDAERALPVDEEEW